MVHEVYADILFLINFSMDYICLYLTSLIINRKIKFLNTILASVIDGIYSVIAVVFISNKLILFISDFTIVFLMCYLVFGKRFYLGSAVFIAVNTVSGGIIDVFYNLIDKYDITFIDNGTASGLVLFSFICIISSLFSLKGVKFFNKRSITKKADIVIHMGNNSVTLTGFTDTGNILHEPISGKPVIITTVASVSSILSDTALSVLSEKVLNDKFNISDDTFYRRFRMIPCHGINGDNIISGFIPDGIEIIYDDHSDTVNAVIGISEYNNFPDNCNAILPGELMIKQKV